MLPEGIRPVSRYSPSLVRQQKFRRGLFPISSDALPRTLEIKAKVDIGDLTVVVQR